MTQSDKALSGIRIIDLTQVESGPTCTQALAWLGADVIKVERPGTGDISRVGVNHEPGLDSLYFLEMNSNKRSVTLNLKQDKGRKILLALVKQADVVVENYATGVLERLGLGYDELCSVNPQIILGRLKGFGTSGPYAHFKAFDGVAQAMGGTYAATGEQDQRPTKVGFSLGDIGTGYHLALGLTASLLQRERTGRGQVVEVAMQEAMVNFSRLGLLMRALMYPEETSSRKGEDEGFVPSRMFACKPGGPDDYCYIIATDFQPGSWHALLRGIGREDLIGDERYETDPARRERQDEVDALIEEWTLQHTKHEVMNRLAQLGVATGAVQNRQDVLQDPHLAERGFFQKVDHPQLGQTKVHSSPIRLSDSPTELEPAPLLGQHTTEVLREILAYSDEEIEALKTEGVV